MRVEPRTLGVLSICSTTELHPKSLTFYCNIVYKIIKWYMPDTH